MSAAAGDLVTMVVTSCGRFDLLERMLRSFRAHNTHPIQRIIVTEDSGDPRAEAIAARIDPTIEVHVAQPRRGQIRSIDYAYGLVETPYIFHAEDDYVFLRGGFIEESLAILKADAQASMVSGRVFFHDEQFATPIPRGEIAGVPVILPPRSLHPGWFGYAFHTGLRRVAEWQRFGPFAPYEREWDVSYAMKRAGLHMVYLAEPAFMDHDEGLSVGAIDPTRKHRGIGRMGYSLKKSAKKTLFTVECALGRYAD